MTMCPFNNIFPEFGGELRKSRGISTKLETVFEPTWSDDEELDIAFERFPIEYPRVTNKDHTYRLKPTQIDSALVEYLKPIEYFTFHGDIYSTILTHSCGKDLKTILKERRDSKMTVQRSSDPKVLQYLTIKSKKLETISENINTIQKILSSSDILAKMTHEEIDVQKDYLDKFYRQYEFVEKENFEDYSKLKIGNIL